MRVRNLSYIFSGGGGTKAGSVNQITDDDMKWNYHLSNKYITNVTFFDLH